MSEELTAMEIRVRREIGDMLFAEYAYWRGVEDESILDVAMGAMGAVSNVLAGVIGGKTADQYRSAIKLRDQPFRDSPLGCANGK